MLSHQSEVLVPMSSESSCLRMTGHTRLHVPQHVAHALLVFF